MSLNQDAVAKRLDAIIRLLMEERMAAGGQKKDMLILLDSVGLTSGEIGRLFNQPSKDIASTLKKLKAEAK